MLILALVAASALLGDSVKVGDAAYLNGCEDGVGVLVVPAVNVWKVPGGLVPGNEVLGTLPGGVPGSRTERCVGAPIVVREVREVDGRVYMKVNAMAEARIGWMTARFAGKRFDRARCKEIFGWDSTALARCTGK